MLSASVQPGTVSLLSTTATQPLHLFSQHVDAGLPVDSFIHLLRDSTSIPTLPETLTMIRPPGWRSGRADNDTDQDSEGHTLSQSVIHIQSPHIPKTYIRCPPETQGGCDLGLRHPWMHIQVRNLGREWSFEVELVDRASKRLRVRCSTFQKAPKVVQTSTAPLLHLPLSFPALSGHTLTAWSTISLHLTPLLTKAISVATMPLGYDDNDEEIAESGASHRGFSFDMPRSGYSHVAYVKIHATCRLRRVWFSEGPPSSRLPWEFELYSAS